MLLRQKIIYFLTELFLVLNNTAAGNFVGQVIEVSYLVGELAYVGNPDGNLMEILNLHVLEQNPRENTAPGVTYILGTNTQVIETKGAQGGSSIEKLYHILFLMTPLPLILR